MILRLLLFIALTAYSCQRTCENVKVGETEFAAATSAFLNYKDGDVLTFSDETGDSKTFRVSTEESEYFICQKVTCDPLDPYKSSYCEYIEAPQYSIFLNTDSTLLAIEASVFAYEPKTNLLYDAVRFTLSHQNEATLASHITDVKFSDPIFSREEIGDIDDFMVEKEDITLGAKTYVDVLICDDDNLTLYYAKEEGIVAFRIGEKLFTLDD